MYYVNREQIEERLNFIPWLIQALEALKKNSDGDNVLHILALERAVHLAIESVTDIGSLMIDGFLMRDASSYEDIVEILRGEEVFPHALASPLLELVKWRKPLVQDYIQLDRGQLLPIAHNLSRVLSVFTESVRHYLDKELGEN